MVSSYERTNDPRSDDARSSRTNHDWRVRRDRDGPGQRERLTAARGPVSTLPRDPNQHRSTRLVGERDFGRARGWVPEPRRLVSASPCLGSETGCYAEHVREQVPVRRRSSCADPQAKAPRSPQLAAADRHCEARRAAFGPRTRPRRTFAPRPPHLHFGEPS